MRSLSPHLLHITRIFRPPINTIYSQSLELDKVVCLVALPFLKSFNLKKHFATKSNVGYLYQAEICFSECIVLDSGE